MSALPPHTTAIPNDLEAFWMPSSANRSFKRRPRMVTGAKDMHYYSADGSKILDAGAGLWCTNAGHNREPIVAAIQKQAAELDFISTFQYGHPKAFALASRIAELAPPSLDHVFFTNSGSEGVESALKIAIAHHNVRGKANRVRLIGRERGFHGMCFGGISVGGIVHVRRLFGSLLSGVDHLPGTYDREQQAFSKGEPKWGAHLADDLERLVQLHGDTIAAVIVEPMAGSNGVFPAPQGYLECLRAICTRHEILLIFDEVVTGFGRLGYSFAAERYGVTPDMIVFAKGVTSGTVPMGGVIVSKAIYDSFMKGPDHASELPHGFTYSGHPLACAAGLATLDVYRDEGLFERVKNLEPIWAEAMMQLKRPGILDIRTVGLTTGIDLEPIPNAPGKRGFDAGEIAFFDQKVMVRASGDTIILAPPFTLSESQIDEIVDKVGRTIDAVM